MRRKTGLAASVLAALMAFVSPALAQSWPDKPVRIVVPFGPGGPADVYARVLGQALGEVFKQQFVIDNKPGAGAAIGTDIVAKAAPDGYTLLMMSNTHTVNETLQPNRPYVLMRDLAPVAPVNSSDLVMVINPAVPARTLAEYIALAKSQPGKLTYASSGPGTPYHMAGELFKAMSGTDILHIPHKNSGDARNAVIGGHVQMMFDAVTAMKSHVEAGQVRALGTTGDKRSSVMPDLPTVSEAGVPGYDATIWLGIMAPKGTPKAIVDKINKDLQTVIDSPEMREKELALGYRFIGGPPEKLTEHLKHETEKWARLAKSGSLLAK